MYSTSMKGSQKKISKSGHGHKEWNSRTKEKVYKGKFLLIVIFEFFNHMCRKLMIQNYNHNNF